MVGLLERVIMREMHQVLEKVAPQQKIHQVAIVELMEAAIHLIWVQGLIKQRVIKMAQTQMKILQRQPVH